MKNFFRTLLVASGLVIASTSFAAGDVATGEKLSRVCVACHGDDGNSAIPNFPKLAGLGEKYLLKQLKDIRSGARNIPEMSGILNRMTESNMADMAAYYASKTMTMSGAKPLEVKTNSGETIDGLALGEQIYRAGNASAGIPACTGCHSPRGLGNSPAGYPRLSGQFANYIEKQLQLFRAGERVNDDAKIMRQVAERMSDAEIKAVSNYVSGLN